MCFSCCPFVTSVYDTLDFLHLYKIRPWLPFVQDNPSSLEPAHIEFIALRYLLKLCVAGSNTLHIDYCKYHIESFLMS